MVGPLPWSPHHDQIKIFTSCVIQYHGVKIGVLHSPPPSTTLSLVLIKTEQNVTLVLHQCSAKLNKNGCANHMASSGSHVVVSGLWYFLCTFTCPMIRSGTPPWFHFVVVLHTNSSKSLIACINTHHMITFWVLENPSPHLRTFPPP